MASNISFGSNVGGYATTSSTSSSAAAAATPQPPSQVSQLANPILSPFAPGIQLPPGAIPELFSGPYSFRSRPSFTPLPPMHNRLPQIMPMEPTPYYWPTGPSFASGYPTTSLSLHSPEKVDTLVEKNTEPKIQHLLKRMFSNAEVSIPTGIPTKETNLEGKIIVICSSCDKKFPKDQFKDHMITHLPTSSTSVSRLVQLPSLPTQSVSGVEKVKDQTIHQFRKGSYIAKRDQLAGIVLTKPPTSRLTSKVNIRGEKLYECSVCEGRYPNRAMKNHLKKHPYTDVCDERVPDREEHEVKRQAKDSD